jgi:hypothetical protein
LLAAPTTYGGDDGGGSGVLLLLMLLQKTHLLHHVMPVNKGMTTTYGMHRRRLRRRRRSGCCGGGTTAAAARVIILRGCLHLRFWGESPPETLLSHADERTHWEEEIPLNKTKGYTKKSSRFILLNVKKSRICISRMSNRFSENVQSDARNIGANQKINYEGT